MCKCCTCNEIRIFFYSHLNKPANSEFFSDIEINPVIKSRCNPSFQYQPDLYWLEVKSGTAIFVNLLFLFPNNKSGVQN